MEAAYSSKPFVQFMCFEVSSSRRQFTLISLCIGIIQQADVYVHAILTD